MFCKKDILRNFTKFTGKRLCQRLFLKEPQARNFIKEEFWHGCFHMNFPKFLRTPFFTEGCFWILFKTCHVMVVFITWTCLLPCLLHDSFVSKKILWFRNLHWRTIAILYSNTNGPSFTGPNFFTTLTKKSFTLPMPILTLNIRMHLPNISSNITHYIHDKKLQLLFLRDTTTRDTVYISTYVINLHEKKV